MKKRLLVVDDDPDILRVLKANLELYGYDAAVAPNWRTAQEVLGRELPELIILDITLPDGNGVEICRELKAGYPRIPVILLTAKDRVSDKVMGLESGAEDYIVKPFETLELMARIKVCLRRYGASGEKAEVGELSIDFKKRSVSVSGREVELTPKEYDLLCLFVNNGRAPEQGVYQQDDLERLADLFLEQGHRRPYPAPAAEDREEPARPGVYYHRARRGVQVQAGVSGKPRISDTDKSRY